MVVSAREITQSRALVTRARAIDFAERVRDEPSCEPVTLDLSGVEALAPSFFDELLGLISELSGHPVRTITIKNAPRPLADKDRRVASGRGAQIRETGDSEWEIRLPASAPA
ncbi:MAG: hypothetical protein F4Y94_09090 [Chloroflexi bacterium]|nr:hypothetical protein [Chloroflexota bacterium]